MSVLQHQQFLPGMESMTGDSVRPPRPRVNRPSGEWSGPIPGQTVMGVHDAAHGIPTTLGDYTPHKPFEVDGHGFVYEGGGPQGSTPSADKAAGNKSALGLYRSMGGGHDKTPEVRAEWAKIPISRVRSDTPVHTSQSWATTEFKSTPEKPAGRQRINSIRKSLSAGEPMKEPAWLVRQSGRLYAMDGHHRIAANREAGLEDYPARIRDLDKG